MHRAERIVAGIHDVDGRLVVFTARPWRLNFRGRRAEQVAAALGHVLAAGLSPRTLGLRMKPGHVVAAQDIRATGRTLLRLDLV